jgi:hypothetical protein
MLILTIYCPIAKYLIEVIGYVTGVFKFIPRGG